MNVIIIQPPLVQLNTAYPSGAYLSAFFKQKGHNVKWYDLSLGLFRAVFCEEGLKKLFSLSENSALKKAEKARSNNDTATYNALMSYLCQSDSWCRWIETIVQILQDGNSESTRELCHRFVFSPDSPRGSRMNAYLENLDHDLSTDDARFLASLAVADLGDYITAAFDSNFSLIRYAESIAVNEAEFSQIEKNIDSPILVHFYDDVLKNVLKDAACFFNAESVTPNSLTGATSTAESLVAASLGISLDSSAFLENAGSGNSDKTLVCISIPFAGTFTAALYTGRFFKQNFSDKVFVSAGGGFVNTELRECNEPALKKYFDALSYDRGYGSYIALFETAAANKKAAAANKKIAIANRSAPGIDCTAPHSAEFDTAPGCKTDAPHINNITKIKPLYKTRLFTDSAVIPPQEEDAQIQKKEDELTSSIIPDFSDIDFSLYPRMIDDTNPMQRLWSDGSWIKAYLAHGCYWHKCAFCDTTLDYVKSYRMTCIEKLFDGLYEQCSKKKVYGIHFVDEALPPVALKKFALLNRKKKTPLTLWGNIRFEKTYTRDFADILSAGGLVGVSGGIEIATGSGLDEINKGTDLDSIVSACCAFKEAGILVHAYMIYGYWKETEQDLINSMETLRQLYAEGLLDSSFWHKFTLTRHSRVYDEWKRGLHSELIPQEIKGSGLFAKNALHFKGEEKSRKFSDGLNLALQSWMHGEHLNTSVNRWFNFKTPQPTVPKDLIKKSIARYEKNRDARRNSAGTNLIWLGSKIYLQKNNFVWTYKGELFEEKIPDGIKKEEALRLCNVIYNNDFSEIESHKNVLKYFYGCGLCIC